MFTSKGYNLKFIQRTAIKDGSSHLYRYIYTFISTSTQLKYVLWADYHDHDFFAIKFYAQKDSKCDHKFSKIINKGDTSNILITCVKVIPTLLETHPKASFGFVGARSLDKKSGTVESHIKTQRYRIYTSLVSTVIKTKTFDHYDYEKISGYILINKTHGDTSEKEKRIKDMLISTYQEIFDI